MSTANTAAALAASDSALQAARTEAFVLKRRLRQYATTLDAVSARAREEVAIALAARNEARSTANRAVMEKDEVASELESLKAALDASRKKHEEMATKHVVERDRALTFDEEAKGLRADNKRLQRLVTETEAKKHEDGALLATRSAELYRVNGLLKAVTEEKDALKDENVEIVKELNTTKRELAIVRHELATRAPPEISQNVRRDIAERAGDAVERRTLRMLRAIARHYLKFKLEIIDNEGVADKADVAEREQVEARVFAFAAAAEDVMGSKKEDDDVDSLGDVRDAQEILQEHLAFIKRMSAVTEPSLGNVQKVVYRMVKEENAQKEKPAPVEEEQPAEVQSREAVVSSTPAEADDDVVLVETGDAEEKKVDTEVAVEEVINVDADIEEAETWDTPPTDVLTQPSVTPEFTREAVDGSAAENVTQNVDVDTSSAPVTEVVDDSVTVETVTKADSDKGQSEDGEEPVSHDKVEEPDVALVDDVKERGVDVTEAKEEAVDTDEEGPEDESPDVPDLETKDQHIDAGDDDVQEITRSLPAIIVEPTEPAKDETEDLADKNVVEQVTVVETEVKESVPAPREEEVGILVAEEVEEIASVESAHEAVESESSIEEVEDERAEVAVKTEEPTVGRSVPEVDEIVKTDVEEGKTHQERDKTAEVAAEPEEDGASRSIPAVVVDESNDKLKTQEKTESSDEEPKMTTGQAEGPTTTSEDEKPASVKEDDMNEDSASRSIPAVVVDESKDNLKSEEKDESSDDQLEMTTGQTEGPTTTSEDEKPASLKEDGMNEDSASRSIPTIVADEAEDDVKVKEKDDDSDQGPELTIGQAVGPSMEVETPAPLQKDDVTDASETDSLVEGEAVESPHGIISESESSTVPETQISDVEKIDVLKSTGIPAGKVEDDATSPDAVVEVTRAVPVQSLSDSWKSTENDASATLSETPQPSDMEEKTTEKEQDIELEKAAKRERKELRRMVDEARNVIFEVRDVIREVRSVVLDVRDRRGPASDKATLGADTTGVSECENASKNVMDVLDDLADEIDVAEVRIDSMKSIDRVIPTSMKQSVSSTDGSASWPSAESVKDSTSSEKQSEAKAEKEVPTRRRGLGGPPPGTIMEDDEEDEEEDGEEPPVQRNDPDDGITVREVPPGLSEAQNTQPANKQNVEELDISAEPVESADEEIDVSGPVMGPGVYSSEDDDESDSISCDLSVSTDSFEDDDGEEEYVFGIPRRPMWPGNGTVPGPSSSPRMFFGRMPPRARHTFR